MGKYIIFRTESASAQGWEKRLLAHTEALTSILAEHFDSSNSPLPEPGYRLREYHRIEQFVDPKFPGASTHSRLEIGKWLGLKRTLQICLLQNLKPSLSATANTLLSLLP